MKEINFKIKGMRQDIDESLPNIEYAYFIKNMRFSDSDKANRKVLCAEKSSKECTITGEFTELPYVIYGHCEITNTLVILGKMLNPDGSFLKDVIVTYELTGPYTFNTTLVFEGNLNIPEGSNIQTVGIDEGNNVKKLYWVDGVNQMRIINLTKKYTNADYLNIRPPLANSSSLTISIDRSAAGNFKAGVIQYVGTYGFKNGQESAFTTLSDIITLSEIDKGGAPNAYIGNAITININNPSKEYELLNIYSIYRSTLNATPEIKRLTSIEFASLHQATPEEINTPVVVAYPEYSLWVKENQEADLKSLESYSYTMLHGMKEYEFPNVAEGFTISTPVGEYIIEPGDLVKITSRSTVAAETEYLIAVFRGVTMVSCQYRTTALSYTDLGLTGETLESTYLFSLLGDPFSSTTLEHKDNVLFTGNITNNRLFISDLKVNDTPLQDSLKDTISVVNSSLNHIKTIEKSGVFYKYKVDTKDAVKQDNIFKFGEHYRLGVVFQHKSGVLSNVIHVGDYKNKIPVQRSHDPGRTSNYKSGGFTGVLTAEIVKALKDADYIKAYPVVCYPEAHDRLVLAQGVVNPTIFASLDRIEGNNYATASWNMRPIPWYKDIASEKILSATGTPVQDSHYYPCNIKKEDIDSKGGSLEFQLKEEDINIITPTYIMSNKANPYYVDANTVTFHTPDFELDSGLDSMPMEGLDFRLVGFAPLDSHQARYTGSITPDKASQVEVWDKMIGRDVSNKQGIFEAEFPSATVARGVTTMSPVVLSPYAGDDRGEPIFALYPFQAKGPIRKVSNYETDYKYANVEHKSLATVGYSSESVYLTEEDQIDAPTGITTPSKYFMENYNTGLILNNIKNQNRNNLYYNGAMNVIRTGYPYLISAIIPYDDFEVHNATVTLGPKMTPMEVAYKTNKHLVFSFNYNSSGSPIILPSLKKVDASLMAIKPPYFENYSKSTPFNPSMFDLSIEEVKALLTANIGAPGSPGESGKGNIYGVHLLGELYRKRVENPFGGTSESAMLRNKYHYAGYSVPLDATTSDLPLCWSKGDTYFTRYDILKALPYSEDNMNKVTTITSVMCETRVNLDYRYDRNRGERDATALNTNNFNLINPVYNQTDNFITHYTEDPATRNIRTYPTDIVWTGVKTNLSNLDAWTKFNAATSYTLDLDKGSLTGLTRFNNELYALQHRGFSKLIYNPRVQIPLSDGVPIEISNSMKMEGAVYISDSIGAMSIHSILSTPNGIYFHDPRSSSLYVYTSQGLQNISHSGGMAGFFENTNSFDIYRGLNKDPWCTYYDYIDNDVYLSNKYTCLAFSEKSSAFTSFYDYTDIPFIVNIKDLLITVKQGKIHALKAGDSNSKYLNRIGDNEIELHVNDGSLETKTFNSIEFESETADNIPYYENTEGFNTIAIKNNYQSAKALIKANRYTSSNLKKKLCINRVLLPRESHKRKRITSTNAYIKLGRLNMREQGKVTLNNIKVKYF